MVAAVSLIAAILWSETTQPPLRYDNENHQSNASRHENSARDDLLAKPRIVFWALVDAIEGHHDLWLVLETLALVSFTATLWWSTRKLWQTSETHGRHLEATVKASEEAARASMLLVGAGPQWPVVGEDYDRVLARQAAIYIYGAVKYFDIFNPYQSRFSEVCFRAFFNGHITNPANGQRAINWDIQVAGEQNTVT